MTATIWAVPPGSLNTVTVTRYPFRNKIINGDMRVDQRSPGSAYNINAAQLLYSIDRWAGYGQPASGVFTLQAQIGSPPPGYSHYLRAAVTTEDTTLAANEFYGIFQRIEGYNIVDMQWGLATAKRVMLSFYCRSAYNEQFSGSLSNSAADKSFPFTFTIDQPNVWEKKVIPISPATTGVWLKNEGVGVNVQFSLGAGLDYLGSDGAWQDGIYYGVPGSFNLMGGVGRTLDITGVQFEIGDVETDFEFRFYSQELALCQRYFEAMLFPGFYVPGTTAIDMYFPMFFKEEKRIVPTITLPAATNKAWDEAGGTITPTTWSTAANIDSFRIVVGHAGGIGGIQPINSPPIFVDAEL